MKDGMAWALSVKSLVVLRLWVMMELRYCLLSVRKVMVVKSNLEDCSFAVIRMFPHYICLPVLREGQSIKSLAAVANHKIAQKILLQSFQHQSKGGYDRNKVGMRQAFNCIHCFPLRPCALLGKHLLSSFN